MESTPKPEITVKTTVATPLEKTWFLWITPEHITQWNSATPEWHTPNATNDLRVGGSFSYRMEARDGSFGFDFGGTYDQVKPHEMISYTLEDGRRVEVTFKDQAGDTEVTEVFEAEETNPIEMQQAGWQAILDNFKRYAESVG
ncbi:SRPBCC family protein [Rufibacter sediminis]|uniref:SRPBCC family protein n=1 Tax=Rufibacter sediminis TaxID=2762756 RepID=A0ABR6VRJ7_9BACT|nr:SRPBCC family protein [Rufibacter sediminis]MBC3539824.1 SRPBCC family protein [Rufibacter sediminis]